MAVRWTAAFLVSLTGPSLAGTALAYRLWRQVLKSVELRHANAFTFLVPVFGRDMGMTYYQERISNVAVAGIAPTLVGIYLVAKGRRPNET